MESSNKFKMLKVYVSEDSKYKGHNLYHVIVLKLKAIGIAGVTVTRGIEGFGHKKLLNTAKVLELSSSLPIVIEVIDTAEKIEKAIPLVKEMVKEGVVIVEDVNVVC